MSLGKDYEGQDCAIARTLELVGERWTMLVLRDAFWGVRRFGDFLAHLDLPRAVLAARLVTLVDAGVLAKRLYSQAPARHEYVLTEAGIELWPIIYAMSQWGERNLGDGRGPRRLFRHVSCDDDLASDGGCPTCDAHPSPVELEIRPGPGWDPNRRDDPVTRALRKPHRLLTPLT